MKRISILNTDKEMHLSLSVDTRFDKPVGYDRQNTISELQFDAIFKVTSWTTNVVRGFIKLGRTLLKNQEGA
jgi:hypothetical protein